MDIETDKSCNDSKTLQDYIRQVKQQSRCCTNSCDLSYDLYKSYIALTSTRNVVNVCTNVRALHCNYNLDRNRSRPKKVHLKSKSTF